LVPFGIWRINEISRDDLDREDFLNLGRSLLKDSVAGARPMSRQWIATRLNMGSASSLSASLASVDSKL